MTAIIGQKGGEGSHFRSEGGGEGLFRGAKPPPNSWPVLGPVRARVRLRRRLRGAFRCPPDRGERERTGHRLPLLSSLPWGGGAKRAPTLPPIFATVGSGPDCTGGAFGPRKGGYPLSRVPYSRRRTGTSPRLRGPRCIPPGCRLGPRPLSRPAAAIVTSQYESRNPPRTSGSRSEERAGPHARVQAGDGDYGEESGRVGGIVKMRRNYAQPSAVQALSSYIVQEVGKTRTLLTICFVTTLAEIELSLARPMIDLSGPGTRGDNGVGGRYNSLLHRENAQERRYVFRYL